MSQVSQEDKLGIGGSASQSKLSELEEADVVSTSIAVSAVSLSSPAQGDSSIPLRERKHSLGNVSHQARRDSFSSLSANGADLYNHNEHEQKGFPLLLTAFVCVVAAVCGLVVAGVHKALVYAGCPLGVNGCNEFLGMEHKGFLLLKWVANLTGGTLPPSIVYIVVSTFGGLILSGMFAYLPEDYAFQVQGGGTLQSLVAVASGERIPLRMALLRVLVTSLYLGTSGTLGGEGPAIQVCTSVAMFIGWRVGIRAHTTQSLLACIGISCGFAASFNSPLAGILFAMEELQHVSPTLSKNLISCILVASVVATATIRASHGNTQVFHVPWGDLSQSENSELLFGAGSRMLISVPIGAICSLVGALITMSVRQIHNLVERFRWRCPTLMVLQALLTACVGAAVFHATGLRGVWGIGAGSLQEAFRQGNGLHAWECILFSLGKLVAMVLAVSARAPGDVLEPVLISGGFIGGFVGKLACQTFGLGAEDLPPCIIFGMVALFAACFRFPLTPVVIVLELVGIGSYSIILPTALASFTALVLSTRLSRPLLDELMHEDGLDLQDLMRSAAASETSDLDASSTLEEGICKREVNDGGDRGAKQPYQESASSAPSCFINWEALFKESCSSSLSLRRREQRRVSAPAVLMAKEMTSSVDESRVDGCGTSPVHEASEVEVAKLSI